jgi:DNA polymerase III sliding clamp (beta) subunit (PCNA family)
MTDKGITETAKTTKFKILTADLKYIFSALKPAIPKASGKPVYKYIKFTYKDSLLSAYATDGYRVHSVTVHVDITDGEKAFCFLLKPFTIPKTKSEFVPCELSEKEILFDFGERKNTFKLGSGDYFDVNAAIPTSPIVYRIGLNPKFLADAAKSLKGGEKNVIVMEFRNPLEPVVIYNITDKSDFRIVCPVRLGESEDL